MYKIMEYKLLLDLSNMMENDWGKIVFDLFVSNRRWLLKIQIVMYVYFLFNIVILKLKLFIKKDERVDNRQCLKLKFRKI